MKSQGVSAVEAGIGGRATVGQLARLALRSNPAIRDAVFRIRRSAAELRYLEEIERVTLAQRRLLGLTSAAGAAAGAGERGGPSRGANACGRSGRSGRSGRVDDDTALITEAKRAETARINALLGRAPDAPIGPIALEASGPLAYASAEIEAMAGAAGDARVAVRDLVSRLTDAERLAARYRDEFIPHAERAVQAAQARLSDAPATLGSFVEAQGAWYDARLAGARAEADRVVLLARLEALAGRSLTAARPQGRREPRRDGQTAQDRASQAN